MAIDLRLTNAGRDAIIDPANVGTQAVQLRMLALGDGSGPGGAGDDARATLRSQRDIEAIEGSMAVAGRIAVRATINTPAAYSATEMGLFARIGDGGAAFLFAYWTDGGTVFVNKPVSIALIVAASVGIVRSAADVTVTVAPNLTIGGISTLLELTDGPGSYVNAAGHTVAIKGDGTGFEFVGGHATQTWVQARLADLVDSSPTSLDTLNELAAALGDDANFAATVNAAIALRARLDGAVFTGRAQGLTRPSGDDGTDFATTAFVQRRTVVPVVKTVHIEDNMVAPNLTGNVGIASVTRTFHDDEGATRSSRFAVVYDGGMAEAGHVISLIDNNASAAQASSVSARTALGFTFRVLRSSTTPLVNLDLIVFGELA